MRIGDLQFEVNDWVYLKISLMKGVMMFREKKKFIPCYVGPYKTLKHIGTVHYDLYFTNNLKLGHPIIHVSLLKKYVGDPTSIVSLKGMEIKKNILYEKVSVEILDRKVKKLRNIKVASLKVLRRII